MRQHIFSTAFPIMQYDIVLDLNTSKNTDNVDPKMVTIPPGDNMGHTKCKGLWVNMQIELKVLPSICSPRN